MTVAKQISQDASLQFGTTLMVIPASPNIATMSSSLSSVWGMSVIASMSRNLQTGCDTNGGIPGNGTLELMELKRYADITPFEYGDIQLRELTPSVFTLASFAEVVLPIGVERSERQSAKDHRIYLCLRGEIEFTVEGETLRLGVGDVLHIDKGETYRFHNGGYEEGRLFLLRVPGPELPESAQP